MKKFYDLKFGLNKSDFFYCYGPHAETNKEFIQETDCVRNSFNPDIDYYDYISVITKEKFGVGTKLTTECDFEKFGAPLIVISDDITTDSEGVKRYGLHFEVVAYVSGFNVWHIVPDPANTERPIAPTLVAEGRFPIEEGSRVTLSVEVAENALIIDVNGNKSFVEHHDIPKTFHIGITACEGVNRFYSITVEDEQG